jgi:hypothetical protein
MDLKRRQFLAAATALAGAAAASVPARAQDAARPLTAVGMFSLLGDGVEVTVNDSPQTDTRIARNRSDTYTFPKIGFDLIVAREVREALARETPTAALSVFNTSTMLPLAEQRRIVAGAHDGALPEWALNAVRQRRLSHVLLVTRQRSEVNLRTGDGDTIGRGTADGIGFYIDTLYQVRNATTGAVAKGALGPHVFVELTLMHTESARVVRHYTIREQWLVAPAESMAEVDPWNFLSAEQKVASLRSALERGLRRALPGVLKGA